ncbi:hypothetical protein ACS0TY_005241 [Phlomoides rotata]
MTTYLYSNGHRLKENFTIVKPNSHLHLHLHLHAVTPSPRPPTHTPPPPLHARVDAPTGHQAHHHQAPAPADASTHPLPPPHGAPTTSRRLHASIGFTMKIYSSKKNKDSISSIEPSLTDIINVKLRYASRLFKFIGKV